MTYLVITPSPERPAALAARLALAVGELRRLNRLSDQGTATSRMLRLWEEVEGLLTDDEMQELQTELVLDWMQRHAAALNLTGNDDGTPGN